MALQKNDLLTSHIRLSWKIKPLLLRSHCPMHTCSIHGTTYALPWHREICCSGSWGDLWAQRGRSLGLPSGARANPATRRGPGSSSSALSGLPMPWREGGGAACPRVPCQWLQSLSQGLGPSLETWAGPHQGALSDPTPALTRSWDQATASELEGFSHQFPRPAGYVRDHALSN